MLNNIINQNYEMHNWKEFVALLIKSYEFVPLRLLVTEIVGPGNVGRNNRTFLSYCLFVSDGG